MTSIKNNTSIYSWEIASLVATPLRWVVGWTYFSAFWRRIVLENKLDPEGMGYVGEKFNHFMPNAFLVKPMIEYLVSSPEVLHIFLWVFTLIEAVVGLFIMLGLFTRLMGLGVILLAAGILFGAGWLGTTCLDEWQIGVLGIVSGTVILFTGSGYFSLDKLLIDKETKITKGKLFQWIGSGSLALKLNHFKKLVLGISVVALFLTLLTNQVFHGGVWGKLHNLSIKPHLIIENARVENNLLRFSLYRDQGADVYGSFVIAIRLKDATGKELIHFDQQSLSSLSENQIDNYYIAKIKPGKNSLIVPLGAKANIQLSSPSFLNKGTYSLEIEDISGIKWNTKFTIKVIKL